MALTSLPTHSITYHLVWAIFFEDGKLGLGKLTLMVLHNLMHNFVIFSDFRFYFFGEGSAYAQVFAISVAESD
jgi:hypothetical protein